MKEHVALVGLDSETVIEIGCPAGYVPAGEAALPAGRVRVTETVGDGDGSFAPARETGTSSSAQRAAKNVDRRRKVNRLHVTCIVPATWKLILLAG
jgi:hypothetical protein